MGTSRHVSARTRQAGDKTIPDRVVAPGHDDWDGGSRFFCGTACWCSDGHDNVHSALDQLLRQRRKPARIRVGNSVLDYIIAPLLVTQPVEPLPKRCEVAWLVRDLWQTP